MSEPFTVDGPVDAVMHFASPASVPDYLNHPIATLRVGSDGTFNGGVTTPVGSQTITMQANAFRLATGAATPSPVVVANQRIGGTNIKWERRRSLIHTGALALHDGGQPQQGLPFGRLAR